MWQLGWRDSIWSQMNQEWDLVIIGGGITGAGIFLEAVKSGYKTLLVESGDFASGTSSKSSKMVHGGLRYLRNAKIQLTAVSVREREWLIENCQGLVDPLDFLLVNYNRDSIPWWVFGFGLAIYDLIAIKWQHQHLSAKEISKCLPLLENKGMSGGFLYRDAVTDDARLVLRVIQSGVNLGGIAINYASVIDLLQNNSGEVRGVLIKNQAPKTGADIVEVKSKIVVNATGAWTDEIRGMIGNKPRIRKLRGSHLFLSDDRLPLKKAISAFHPTDNRPVYALPWEDVILIGTTDVDHRQDMNVEPSISSDEIDYLLTFIDTLFPSQNIKEDDIISTHSGIRSVVNTGKKDPCKESREHIIWDENGLITVTGGKLTTFRFMAQEALKVIKKGSSIEIPDYKGIAIFEDTPPTRDITMLNELDSNVRGRLVRKFGHSAIELVENANKEELEPIPGSTILWAELRHAARDEGVIHLSDLMLRRTRVGITVPTGGLQFLNKIERIVLDELKWTNSRWAEEVSAYRNLWKSKYSISHIM